MYCHFAREICFVLWHEHFPWYVCSVQYGWFWQFLNFVLSWHVAQVLSEWFWNGSSRPYYYWYVMIMIVIILLLYRVLTTICVKQTVFLGRMLELFCVCNIWGKKVKCTLVHELRVCRGRTAHRGSRGIALLFHDHGTRRGWGVGVTPRPLFTPGKDPVPIVHEGGWVPGPVWTAAENLAPSRIRSVQPVASRYTDWATWPTIYVTCNVISHDKLLVLIH